MATIKLRGDSWQLQWSEGGEQQRKSLGQISKREAETKRIAKEYELRTGKRIVSSGLTFGHFSGEYKRWHNKTYPDSTERITQIINQHLTPSFEFESLDQISPKVVEFYAIDRLDAGAKRATIQKELRTLIAVLNKALDWGEIHHNPLGRLMRNMRDFFKLIDSKPPHFYVPEELQKLYDVSKEKSPWWKLYANSGLRRTEGLQIQPRRDIGKDSMRVLSSEEERTKSAKWREIPLFDGIREALEDIKPDGKYLLPRIRPESLSRAFLVMADRAGVEGSLHSLRHTFCSHLVMQGMPLRKVQILAGHAHIATTEKYLHLAPDYLKSGGFNLAL